MVRDHVHLRMYAGVDSPQLSKTQPILTVQSNAQLIDTLFASDAELLPGLLADHTGEHSADHANKCLDWRQFHIHVQLRILLVHRDESICDVPGIHLGDGKWPLVQRHRRLL